jgi:signal transduction histidine kinase
VYYKLVLSRDVTATVDEAQAKLDNKAAYVAELIRNDNSGTLPEIIEQDSSLRDNNVVIIDIDTNTSAYGKEISDGKIAFYGTAITEHGGKKLLVKVYRHYDITGLRTFAIIKRLLFAEGIIVAGLMVLLGFAIHYVYVRPLISINEKMSSYRKNKKTDIADVKRSDELGQIEREFYRLVGTIEEEKKLQTRIIASISHDVKTPLTSVMGYVERLRSGKVTDATKAGKYLQTIYGRAQDIKDIIGEFDEYLSNDAEGNPLNLKSVGTDYLCSLLSEEYTEELSLKNVGFKAENRCGNCSVNVDISKIRRVFGNIIGNALRYVPVPSGLIRVTCEKAGDKVRFRIEDNGPGVPEGELERIFEAFYTRDSSRGSGSGLGLSICKSIVEAHGGSIYAQNSELGGLAVVVELGTGDRGQA